MSTLLLRITLAPLLILLVTLVQRRLGPRVGGRLIGLPVITFPFLIALYAGYGREITAEATVGIVAGQAVVVGFAAAYVHVARWLPPLACLAVALGAGAVSAFPISALEARWPGRPGAGLAVGSVAVAAAVALALATWPKPASQSAPPRVPGRWEIPVRMALAGTLVATLASAARLVGPHLAGVLASTPVMLTILMPSIHRTTGREQAAELARGALISIPVTSVFISTIGYTLRPLGPWLSFGLALVALFAVDGGVRALSGRRTGRIKRTAVTGDNTPATAEL